MKGTDSHNYSWQKSKADTFWGEIAPTDHVVQIYENDDIFLDALAGFVGGGINAGDCCIVVATPQHIALLEDRLRQHGVRVDTLIDDKRYMPFDAEQVLSQFMINGWPDERHFTKIASQMLEKARANNRKIRAFGEMVAILWSQGHYAATIQLEHLWNRLCKNEKFCIFCAYPKTGFTKDFTNSVKHICNAHSKMITGKVKQLTEVYYREIL
jgi:hypothetical protein